MNQSKLLESFHVILKGIAFEAKHGEIKKFETFFHPEEDFVAIYYESHWKDGTCFKHEVSLSTNATVNERIS